MADATAAPSLEAYTNPYKGAVLDGALSDLWKTGAQAKNQLGADAFQAGAYGDGRHGVEAGVLDANLGKAAGDLSAGINSDAFDKAMGWMNTDVDRQTNTSLANAGLDNQWFANQLSALGLQNQIQTNSVSQGSSLINALLGLDTYDKTQAQSEDNVDYGDFQDAQNWDANKLSQFLGFISGAPGQTGSSTSSSSSTPDNSWASMLGSSLANIFKQ